MSDLDFDQDEKARLLIENELAHMKSNAIREAKRAAEDVGAAVEREIITTTLARYSRSMDGASLSDLRRQYIDETLDKARAWRTLAVERIMARAEEDAEKAVEEARDKLRQHYGERLRAGPYR